MKISSLKFSDAASSHFVGVTHDTFNATYAICVEAITEPISS